MTRCPYGNDHAVRRLPSEVRTRAAYRCDTCGATCVPTPSAELERA